MWYYFKYWRKYRRIIYNYNRKKWFNLFSKIIKKFKKLKVLNIPCLSDDENIYNDISKIIPIIPYIN